MNKREAELQHEISNLKDKVNEYKLKQIEDAKYKLKKNSAWSEQLMIMETR